MSFQQGLSGLNATSKSLDVIGNNIANAGTYGAKASRAEFADVYAAALNGSGTNDIGIGTRVAAVAQQFSQGTITTTDNPMDLAISGGGFFQVGDGVNPPNYTRNGQFKIDRDGYIVNNDGKKLLGYTADATGVIQPGRSVPLQLPTGGITPAPTTKVALEMNLDARKPAIAGAPAIDFGDAKTYSSATSLTVFDPLGRDIALTYYFQKSPSPPAPDNTWNVFATADGQTVAGTQAAPTPITTLGFNADGTFNQSSSADFQLDGRTLGLDFSKSTQFGSAYGITMLTQDGHTAGQLTSVSVDASGIVNAKYSNGQSRPAGQIEIATFRNPQGLQPLGNNAWASTHASGEPVPGTPGAGNLGLLQAGALEESSVDLTGELVNMITAQRVYQANAQTIKTQDQVMQTLVNLR
jgi:flagellar hook protein FlgE